MATIIDFKHEEADYVQVEETNEVLTEEVIIDTIFDSIFEGVIDLVELYGMEVVSEKMDEMKEKYGDDLSSFKENLMERFNEKLEEMSGEES